MNENGSWCVAMCVGCLCLCRSHIDESRNEILINSHLNREGPS
jgi:hypothetical protein